MNKRNFRLNPVTEQELTETYWYAVADDLIGGTAVSNVNKPTSQLNPYNGEFEIANFMSRPTAEHLCRLQNAWWQDQVYMTYAINIWLSGIDS